MTTTTERPLSEYPPYLDEIECDCPICQAGGNCVTTVGLALSAIVGAAKSPEALVADLAQARDVINALMERGLEMPWLRAVA